MTLLETISGPRDLKKLGPDELPRLAGEVRDLLIQTVSKNGGHLGPNLGVVELTIALHRVFDSPVDKILFDVGHQAYVHKLLTGRQAEFGTLRQAGGISGYPSQAESEHDVIENSHASTGLCYADGLAKAYQLRGETERSVVAVIGDGALTGGMAWEALNNIAGAPDRRVVIVVNDNGRSYQPTIGGLADHMAAVRVSQRYENVLDYIKTTLSHTPVVGPPIYGTLHGIKKGIKDVLQPQVLFEDLGLKYLGPIDGHDEQAVEHALRRARDFGGAVLVHVITKKGFGYPLAEQNDEDCLHQVPPAKPAAGAAAGRAPAAAPRTWSSVFGDELAAIGARRPDVVAITAAMLHPTGLAAFARAYPDRVFDVGIAEQHAMTSAAGLAMGGLHPVVAHLRDVPQPGLRPAADGRGAAQAAGDRGAGPGRGDRPGRGQPPRHVGRLDPAGRARACGSRRRGTPPGWPSCSTRRWRSATAPPCCATRRARSATRPRPSPSSAAMDVLAGPAGAPPRTCCWSGPGRWRWSASQAAERLADHGIGVTVVDPRWVKPLDEALVDAAREHRLVVTVEDNGRAGGFGDAVCRLLRDHDVDTPAQTFGLPQEFLDHGERGQILDDAGPGPAAPGPGRSPRPWPAVPRSLRTHQQA